MAAHDGDVYKCQNGDCNLDFDLENEVKVPRSRHFNWSFLGQFSTHNQNVWCSEISFCVISGGLHWKVDFNFWPWNSSEWQNTKIIISVNFQDIKWQFRRGILLVYASIIKFEVKWFYVGDPFAVYLSRCCARLLIQVAVFCSDQLCRCSPTPLIVVADISPLRLSSTVASGIVRKPMSFQVLTPNESLKTRHFIVHYNSVMLGLASSIFAYFA